MTVDDLKKALNDFPPDAPVLTENGWGIAEVTIDQNGQVVLVEEL